MTARKYISLANYYRSIIVAALVVSLIILLDIIAFSYSFKLAATSR